MKRLEEKIAEMHKRHYRALRAHDPALYKRSIEAAEGVTLNFNLPQKVAVEIEVAVVMMVCNALKLKP